MRPALSLLLLPLAFAACSRSGSEPPKNDTEWVTAEADIAFANDGDDSNTGGDTNTAVLADDARRSAAEATAALAGGEIGKCDFDGWSHDTDPAGLNVRAGPSADAAITGMLPPFLREDVGGLHTGRGAEFSVTEARNGWFRISNVQVPFIRDGDVEWKPSTVSGWIHGRYLAFALQTEKAFAAPDLASPVVATAWQTKEGRFFELGYDRPTDCKGKWVKLTVSGRDRKPHEGWVSGICGIQETTCDGGVYGTMLDGRIE